MRYRLRTLLILLAVGPMVLAGAWIEAGPLIASVAVYVGVVTWMIWKWRASRSGT